MVLQQLVRDLAPASEQRDEGRDREAPSSLVRQLQLASSAVGRNGSIRISCSSVSRISIADIARAEAKQPEQSARSGRPDEARRTIFPAALPREEGNARGSHERVSGLLRRGIALDRGDDERDAGLPSGVACGSSWIHPDQSTAAASPPAARSIRPPRPNGSLPRAWRPGWVAQVLVSKYCDHTPLYRQATVKARSISIARPWPTGWAVLVGGLEALHARLAANLFASTKLFADDTPLPVLDPGRGRTKTGRLWAYARDDRPWAGPDPAAAVYLTVPIERPNDPLRI